jgi:RNA polymerase sporulation-specific sigma factor
LDYSKLEDNEIIKRIHKHDDDAVEYLLKKYGYLVKREVRTVYLIGAEMDDLSQEGMIGLFKAMRDYQPEKDTSFVTFASVCIRRQIQNAITNSNRKKHVPLNSYVSLYMNSEEDDNFMLEERLVTSREEDPEKLLIAKEQQKDRNERIQKELSKLEKQVLTLYLQGMSYEAIAEHLGKTEKAVDNALQRIRGKLSRK